MLTYDTLIEQAKLRNMPQDKGRGILREYLQVLMLKQLYRTDAGKKLFFTGGTYLRLVHGLKRFSEDLDFNSNEITNKSFETMCGNIVIELKRFGLSLKADFAHWDSILVGRFTYPDIESYYGIAAKHTRKRGLLIKLEVNKPKWQVTAETEVITGYGETFPCLCTDKSILFADKIDALAKKHMGRHIYDVIFMLSQRFPVHHTILKEMGYKNEPFDELSSCINSLASNELRKQAEVLRPFLFDEQETDLIRNAKTIVEKLIQKYK
jgi:predicted nucleotidyltransferase component of viral defense system